MGGRGFGVLCWGTELKDVASKELYSRFIRTKCFCHEKMPELSMKFTDFAAHAILSHLLSISSLLTANLFSSGIPVFSVSLLLSFVVSPSADVFSFLLGINRGFSVLPARLFHPDAGFFLLTVFPDLKDGIYPLALCRDTSREDCCLVYFHLHHHSWWC
ncbi:hypothetical protein ILYODFUR_036918 [Ilyodon furcidens]|uniref:Uncharacterized protein n=1 Tax=Ilyodon furcidens TaxID=33524 RepID=A0ABV0VKM0_9TELE